MYSMRTKRVARVDIYMQYPFASVIGIEHTQTESLYRRKHEEIV